MMVNFKKESSILKRPAITQDIIADCSTIQWWSKEHKTWKPCLQDTDYSKNLEDIM